MWRSFLLAVVLAGVLAGCSLGNGGAARQLPDVTGSGNGIIKGRVLTTACGGLLLTAGCAPTPYRGSLAFCSKKLVIGPCPSASVDARGHYSISLRPGRHYLVPAPGNGNVVYVKPRWVVVQSGQTTTVNINGANLMR
jgi:hypothetical protein